MRTFVASGLDMASQRQGLSTRCVLYMVEEQAERRPNEVAVVDSERALTYRQLEDRSRRLANGLRALDVHRDIPVGLCMSSRAAIVVGAVGILKSGGAYLPLDPDHPRDRLLSILDDAGISVVVTDDRGAARAWGEDRDVLSLDASGWLQGAPPPESPEPDIAPDDLAYVIYTSGSTGTPKGVEITHRSLLNLVAWHQRAFAVSPADRASQLAGPAFDAAVWELWPYLSAGVPVHIASDSVRSEPQALRNWLVRERITLAFVPTVMAERVLELDWPADTPLRLMLTGGDALHRYPPADLPFELVNNYGPTECTVVATSGTVPPVADPSVPPSIGRPITNVRVHVVDEALREVADGSPGELCIGGVSLARGYRNRPDLTAERFVSDPFSDEPRARLYRTGDLVRRLPDGDIAFQGRIDDQVKIRGYRIEPGEVTHVLERHAAVREGAVVARDDGLDGKRLVAYWVRVDGVKADPEDLLAFLRGSLPDYMLPSAFVQLDELPLTSNGKVDRAALPPPDPELPDTSDDFVEPVTVIEQEVAEILAPLLGLERVSTDANFFLLGGHSLLGTQLIARIRDRFDIDLSLKALFEEPTVRDIAREIERLILEKLDALEAAEGGEMLGATAGNGERR